MTRRVELLKEIDVLPPEYFGEVLDFVVLLQQKVRQKTVPTISEAVPAKHSRMTEKEEIEYINRNAEWLNREAMDTFSYQDLDALEDNLERLTPQERAVLSEATVQFSLADINHASKGCLNL